MGEKQRKSGYSTSTLLAIEAQLVLPLRHEAS